MKKTITTPGELDAIIMKNMAFYGFHGVLPQESDLGQKFFINVTLYLDTQAAGLSDKVEHTVSYAEAYEVIKKHAEQKRYQLIEALAEHIAQELLAQFHMVQKVDVEVQKPWAPVSGIFDYMAVQITRGKNAKPQ